MNKELIRIERKILRYCLLKMKKYDLAEYIDYLSDKDIHEVFLIIVNKFKEV